MIDLTKLNKEDLIEIIANLEGGIIDAADMLHDSGLVYDADNLKTLLKKELGE